MRPSSSPGVGFDRLLFDREVAARQRLALVELARSASLRDRVIAHVLAKRSHLGVALLKGFEVGLAPAGWCMGR